MGLFSHWYFLLGLLILVLIIYGPGKLPEVGGAIGKGLREFRKASSELTDEIKRSADTQHTPPASSQTTPESRPADTSTSTDRTA
jgi:TatA/E family protein of Tat protein translocase